MSDKADFRTELANRGFSQSGFARFLAKHGDPRPFPTLLRSVSNWARSANGPPGEIRVVLTLLDRLNSREGEP